MTTGNFPFTKTNTRPLLVLKYKTHHNYGKVSRSTSLFFPRNNLSFQTKIECIKIQGVLSTKWLFRVLNSTKSTDFFGNIKFETTIKVTKVWVSQMPCVSRFRTIAFISKHQKHQRWTVTFNNVSGW